MDRTEDIAEHSKLARLSRCEAKSLRLTAMRSHPPNRIKVHGQSMSLSISIDKDNSYCVTPLRIHNRPRSGPVPAAVEPVKVRDNSEGVSRSRFVCT